jgi:hypothetical protein
MAGHGHTGTWGTYIGAGCTHETKAKSWYTQFKTWLAARREARRLALNACWDTRREAVHPFRADVAIDMVPTAYTEPQAVPRPRGLRSHLKLVTRSRPALARCGVGEG